MSLTMSNAVDDMPPVLSHAAVKDAQRRLAGRVVRTPVLGDTTLDRLAGARLWFKAENLQRGGSFKMRGAQLAVQRLAGAGSRGVVAVSTGNHGIAVALAARDHDLPAVLVLSPDVAPTKIDRVRAAGAEIHLVDAPITERFAAMDELCAERGFDTVDPFENPHCVAGQGTATAELIDQVTAAGAHLDAIVVPVGAGSGVAGACLATAGQRVAVFGAEPAAVPAFTEAMRRGEPVAVAAGDTIADGLRPEVVGRLPFDIAHKVVAGVLTVDEDAIGQALILALTHTRQLIEPSSAVAVAAALRLAADNATSDIGVLLTGGNIDMRLVADLLARSRG